ncbi:beta-glucosidase [Prolixibacteraceae bacterium JC049]|nr:beta-glucosidase [Prolixibacteraceae bacterium JC049]
MFRRNYLTAIIGLLILCSASMPANRKGKAKKTIYHQGWIDFNKNGQKDVYEDSTADIDDRIKDLLSQMTIEEKTCQMVTLYGYGRVAKDEIPVEGWKNEIWKDGLGNIDEASNGVYKDAKFKFPYDKHVWALNKIQKFFVEDTRLGIPVEFTDEGIRGLNHYKATSFPAQIGMGSTWNKNLLYETGKCIGSEGYALGYNNIYSPVLDVARDQRWGRIVESFGEDPFLVAQYGVNLVKGVQEEGVSSSLKHFAIYSAPKGGRDGHVRCDPHITMREAHQMYLYPFRKAIEEAGARGVMASYNDYDGVPIIGSYYFLTELLRKTYGFKGYVVSDSDAVAWLYTKHRVAQSYKEAVRQCVVAGMNVRTTFNPPRNFVNPLRELIAEGALSEELIDERVADVLYVKFKEGLFDKPYRDEKKVNKVVRNKAHLDLALQASRESIVLLKNKNNTLPLDASKLKNVLVCGPNAKAQSSSLSRYGALGVHIITGLEGITNELKGKANVEYALGAELHDKGWPDTEVMDIEISSEEQALIDEAVAKAKQSDVVIAFMGEDEKMVGENLSRSSLQLPGRQKDLLKALKATGKPVIVVLINGRPLAMNYTDRHLDALMAAWFPGEFGGTAIADVLFGNYNPAGRCASTWPRSIGQIPINFPYKPFSNAGQAKSGPNGVGESRVVEPLYYFGYGLSYTTFEYSELKLENNLTTQGGELKVKCTIKNTGKKGGDEVPQLYIHDEYSSVTTYDWQLRGFDRIHLAPGESKEVEFVVKSKDLSLINRDMKEVVEAGTFQLRVGASSTDIRLKGNFEIKY